MVRLKPNTGGLRGHAATGFAVLMMGLCFSFEAAAGQKGLAFLESIVSTAEIGVTDPNGVVLSPSGEQVYVFGANMPFGTGGRPP